MEKNDKIRDLETSNSNLEVVVKELNNQTDDLNGQIKSQAEQLARQAEEIEALKLKVQSLVRMIEKKNEGSNMNCKSNEILKGFDENVQDYPIRSDPIQDENIDKKVPVTGKSNSFIRKKQMKKRNQVDVKQDTSPSVKKMRRPSQ